MPKTKRTPILERPEHREFRLGLQMLEEMGQAKVMCDQLLCHLGQPLPKPYRRGRRAKAGDPRSAVEA